MLDMENDDEIRKFKIEAGVAAGGSNCWAVHGNHTESGSPFWPVIPMLPKQ